MNGGKRREGARTRQATAPRVLVDSSVWIDFYRPAPPSAVRSAVLEALSRDAVFTNPLVLAEVVQGAPDEKTLELLLDDFAGLRPLELNTDTGKTAARIGFVLRREGRPVPATDLLIAASALTADCEVWHRDAHFDAIAQVAPLSTRAL